MRKNTETVPVTVVSGSLAPAPEKQVDDSFDSLTDEEVADRVLDNLNSYIGERPIEAHLKLRESFPRVLTIKKSKSIIKERYHKKTVMCDSQTR